MKLFGSSAIIFICYKMADGRTGLSDHCPYIANRC